ncbi:succinate dehydrogenase, cytochrome b556 subunit [Novosphingobium sp. 1949]|uniref:Succinate dehydrogenase cytochrome b556 subunit n=1 Tax=Novosphingobium organovorum TaxID=2930092 RepID=A0ABT0BAC8_9SPHN|nr:succinate dehydrogenase, cytochrome b556 subunit [Novosphingobium organovorum]MCJ2182006.1 succinate dehydrogenase, cytochrome b556 subunit [Novosphingobium organovorum]
MATAGSKNRPLSPHLQIWRWGPHMFVSIMHRVSGQGLVVGLALLLWWLGALASGPAAYAQLVTCMTSVPGYVVLVGISWCFFNHMMSGLRHFVLDIGAGFELKGNRTWSILTSVLGVVLTIAFWAILLLR